MSKLLLARPKITARHDNQSTLHGTELQKAWQEIIQILTQQQVQMHFLPAHDRCRELYQISDCATILGRKALMASTSATNAHIKTLLQAWLQFHQYTIIHSPLVHNGNNSVAYAAGADTIIVDNHFGYVGYGFNTHHAIIEHVQRHTRRCWQGLHLIHRNFSRLRDCLLFLDEEHCMAYMPAFATESQKRLENNHNIIPVTEQDAYLGAFYSISFTNRLIIASNCGDTQLKLEQYGYNFIPTNSLNHIQIAKKIQLMLLNLTQ